MANNCGPTSVDPILGLLQYVQVIKPYHTKVLEATVEYIHSDNVIAYIPDRLEIAIDMMEPQQPQIFDCLGGYGIYWDDFGSTTPFNVVDVDTTTYKIIVEGDQTSVLLPGTKIQLHNSTPENDICYSVYSSTFDGTNTIVQVMQPIADPKPVGPMYFGYLTLAQVGYSDDFYCYPVCQDPLDVHAFIVESLSFSFGPETDDEVTFADILFGTIGEYAEASVVTNSGQTLLPASLDGPALDMCTLDENIDVIVALYGQTTQGPQ